MIELINMYKESLKNNYDFYRPESWNKFINELHNSKEYNDDTNVGYPLIDEIVVQTENK